eukprot:2623317-Pleurochrysis_carterae.AAC.4
MHEPQQVPQSHERLFATRTCKVCAGYVMQVVVSNKEAQASVCAKARLRNLIKAYCKQYESPSEHTACSMIAKLIAEKMHGQVMSLLACFSKHNSTHSLNSYVHKL